MKHRVQPITWLCIIALVMLSLILIPPAVASALEPAQLRTLRRLQLIEQEAPEPLRPAVRDLRAAFEAHWSQ